jgi:FHS family Na+ dependent glucose MFS transporter 1
VLLPAAILATLPSPAAPKPAEDGTDKPANWLLVALIALIFFLFVGAELGYGGWIYTYALETGLADARMAGYLNSLFWVGLTLGRLIAIPLSTRLRPQPILAIDFAGILLFLGLALAWPTTPAVIWGATFGTGLAMASVFPGLMNLAGVHLPITGRITGWFLVGTSLGSMLVPWLIGQGIERIGPQSALAILFGASFLAALVFALFLLVVRRRAGVAVAWAG